MRCHCHRAKRFCVWCIATTVGFPVEHVLWERAPLLSSITRAMGL